MFDSLLAKGILEEKDRLLWEYLTEARARRFLQVLFQRSGSLSVILESVHDGHNQAAVLRSCEAFGIQDIGIVENDSPFSPSPSISRGTEKWLNLNRFSSIEEAVSGYKEKGFRVYASMLGPQARSIEELDLSGPVAVLFGNEHSGISQKARELCDETFIIPMTGFVESLNISVAVAVSLTILTKKARKEQQSAFFLDDSRKKEVLRAWLAKSSDVLKKIKESTNRGAQASAAFLDHSTKE